MTKVACGALVDRVIRNQDGMVLSGWGLRSSEAETASEEASVMSDACDFFDSKIVERIEVNCSTYMNSDDNGGSYPSHTLSVEVDVTLPDGSILTIEDGNDLSELLEVVEGLEADDDEKAPYYREAYDLLEKECGWIGYGDTMMEHGFWDARGENAFELTRDDIKFFTVGGKVDHVGLSRAVFRDASLELSTLKEAPAYWSEFEMERMADRLAAGMLPEAMSSTGQSALCAAAYFCHKGAAEALLAAGADPNRLDASAINPVITAAYRADLGVLDLLLEAGGNINGLPHAPTALFALQARGRNQDFASMSGLIDRGLDIYAVMPDGGVLHDDVERYVDSETHEEQIRVIRAAGLAGALEGAMSSGGAFSSRSVASTSPSL